MSKQGAVTQPIEQAIQNQDLQYPARNTKCSMFILVISLLFLALTMVLNVTIQTPLFLLGLNFIYNYQSAFPQMWIQNFYNVVSYTSFPTGVAVVILLHYVIVKRKLMLIIHLIYYFYCTYIIAILVQSYQQSRPIWYDLRIKNWDWNCGQTYANPSGHSFSVVVLFEPIVSDSIGTAKWRRLIMIPLFLLWILVPISRVYLGVHSVNQILFGLTLGMISLVLFKYIYQKQLYELCWQFLTGIRHNLKLIALICVHLITIAIPIIFYFHNLTFRPMLIRDIDNIEKQCKIPEVVSQKVQESMLVVGCSIGSLSFGFMYGLIVLMNRLHYRRYFLGMWYYQRKLKIPLKILTYIIGAGLPFLLFYLLSSYAVKDSPIGDYVLYVFATTFAGFGVSCFAPMLAVKWNIIALEDPDKQKKAPQKINSDLPPSTESKAIGTPAI